MYDEAYSSALLEYGIDNGTVPSKLYKFRNIDKRTIEIIKNSEFYFSSPTDFNDPFDCNLSYKKDYNKEEIEEAFKRFIKRYPSATMEKMIETIGYESKSFYDFYSKINQENIPTYGILSLSKRCKNISMWSHYSDNHKGLVFELNIKEDLDFFNSFGMVNYKNEYELLSYAKDNREELIKLFLTKYTDWEYEKEVRIIDYEKYGCKKFKKKALKTIVFGYKTNIKYIKCIIRLCQKNGFEHVTFQRTKLIPGKFALDFDALEKEDFI